MQIKKGIAVSPGIGISKVMIIDAEDYLIPRRTIELSQRLIEVQRVKNAFKSSIDELTKIEVGKKGLEEQKIKDIFAVHLGFLHDKSLLKRITDLIRAEYVTAEFAVSTTMRDIAAHFAKEKDRYISERAADIYDIERRILKHLLGRKGKSLAISMRRL